MNTRAKMFFPNINHMQAAKIDLDLQTRPSKRPNKSVQICCKCIHWLPRYLPKTTFLSMVTLTFDLDLQTRLSEGPNMPSL